MPPSAGNEKDLCVREGLRGLISRPHQKRRLQMIFLAHLAPLQSLGTRGLVARLKCFLL